MSRREFPFTVFAGAIAMGLGGYLAAKSDAEHYAKERETTHHVHMTQPLAGIDRNWPGFITH